MKKSKNLYFKDERIRHLYKVNKLTPGVLFALYRNLYISFMNTGELNDTILKQLYNINLSIVCHTKQQMSPKLKYKISLFFKESCFFKDQYKAYRYLESNCIDTFETDLEDFIKLLKTIDKQKLSIIKEDLLLFKLKINNNRKLFKLCLDSMEYKYLRQATKNAEYRSSLLLVYSTYSMIIESQNQIIQFIEYF